VLLPTAVLLPRAGCQLLVASPQVAASQVAAFLLMTLTCNPDRNPDPQVAAFLPAKGKFVPDEEEEMARPKGALQDPSISLANPKKVRCLGTLNNT